MDWLSIGDSLWRIVLFGIAIGAGLPAIFALGLRAISPAQAMVTVGGTRVASGVSEARPGPVRLALGLLCFAVVLGAVGYGIFYIAAGGH